MNDVSRGLLRETLRARMTPERAAGCLDSQTLAAWSEGTLNARDREAIEEHASDCARCQALLAAMVTTTPPVEPSRSWRLSTLGWFAPLAAAAAAILLWINIPGTPVERPATAPAASTAVLPAPSSTPEMSPPASPSTTPPRIAERPVETRTQARAKTAAVPSPPPASTPAVPPDAQAIDTIAQKKDAPQPADAAPAGKAASVETRDAVVVSPASGAVVAPPPQVEARPLTASAEPASKSKFDSAVMQEAARRTVTPTEIPSPDPGVRWRILAGGHVARSTDRGATWQQQSTGASVMLTAGAAPSATVCWMVGFGGTVVVTTDGGTWKRAPFPQALDLVAVRASDGSNATVTALDGRTFTTTDGGKSWRQP